MPSSARKKKSDMRKSGGSASAASRDFEDEEMGSGSPDDLAALLVEVRSGREGARERLVARVYAGLRRMAAGLMRGERAGVILQPSAVVNDALIRLLDGVVLNDMATPQIYTLSLHDALPI